MGRHLTPRQSVEAAPDTLQLPKADGAGQGNAGDSHRCQIHTQNAAGKSPSGIHRRTGVFVLKRSFAGDTQAGSAQIVARSLLGTLSVQSQIDEVR
jgi:hypothetical protein